MGQVELGRFVNLLTHTEPTKKKLATQPNPPTPKNRPNPMGWIGTIWEDRWVP